MGRIGEKKERSCYSLLIGDTSLELRGEKRGGKSGAKREAFRRAGTAFAFTGWELRKIQQREKGGECINPFKKEVLPCMGGRECLGMLEGETLKQGGKS